MVFYEILVSCSIFFTFCLIQILLRKLNIFNSLHPLYIFVFSIFYFVIIILFLNYFIINIEENIYMLNILIHYLLLIMILTHLLIGLSKSVSLRIMYEIYMYKDFQINIKDLQKKYPMRDILYKRIDLLEKNNWIIKKDSRYFCTKKAIILIISIIGIRKLYNLKDTG